MATALPTDEQLFTVSVSDDHRRLPVTLAAIATVSIAAAGWYFWQSGVDLYLRSGGIAPVAQHAATNAAEVKPVSTLTVARTDASANQPSVSDPTAHVDEARPAAILEPSATTGMTEAAAPEETTPSAPSKAPAVETSRPAIAQPQPVSMPPSLSGAEASASPDTPIVIEGPPAAPGMPNAADAPRAADPSERAEAPRTVPGDVVAVSRPATDETPSIRAVLARYAVAYSQLDAAAAAAVWPDVDRRALTRAFETLQSQHVSLGRCDVAVSTAIAHARCSGTTAWTPKVGGGVHTAARTWTFDLAKQNDAWLISSVTVR